MADLFSDNVRATDPQTSKDAAVSPNKMPMLYRYFTLLSTRPEGLAPDEAETLFQHRFGVECGHQRNSDLKKVGYIEQVMSAPNAPVTVDTKRGASAQVWRLSQRGRELQHLSPKAFMIQYRQDRKRGQE
jgi:hypothetical protein